MEIMKYDLIYKMVNIEKKICMYLYVFYLFIFKFLCTGKYYLS